MKASEVKATDLRIGNWVNVYGIYDRVTDVKCDCINTYQYPSMTYENVFGIPLNEEWLIKLGFEKFGIWFRLFPIHVRHDKIEDAWHIAIELHTVKTKIQYVHQLQNLFHSLCGTELTIKE